MKFRTEIIKPDYDFQITYHDPVFLMGSCFSDNMGSKLRDSKFKVESNPLGIVYNPVSLAKQLAYILDPERLEINQLHQDDGMWHHFDFHGKFSSPKAEKTIEKLSSALGTAHLFLKKSAYLFITFGTATIFRRQDTAEVV